MTHKLTHTDLITMVLKEHYQIIDDLIENIKMYSGKGRNKKLLVSPGFKIAHKETGLSYTISGVEETQDGIVLVTVKPSGEEFKIRKSNLKQYERL